MYPILLICLSILERKSAEWPNGLLFRLVSTTFNKILPPGWKLLTFSSPPEFIDLLQLLPMPSKAEPKRLKHTIAVPSAALYAPISTSSCLVPLGAPFNAFAAKPLASQKA